MKDEIKFPETLQQAMKYFADEDRAFEYMKSVRWPNGKVSCPRCGCEEVSFISTRKLWTCKKCETKKQFTIRVGTILEDSAIKFDKWICAFWLIANAKNGISSYEIGRALGVTQKTGWFMLQRIRLAMQSGTIEKLKGEIEADETYIGGKVRNMHIDKKRKRGRGTGGVGKAIVMGLLERGKSKTSIVRLKHVPNARRITVQGEIRQHVETGSQIFTDALPSYNGLNSDYVHKAIDHAKEYVRGNVHTNGLENFWSLLKRCIRGTYVSVEPFHLFRYLDEQAFRFNERRNTDRERFIKAISGITKKGFTYAQLIGEDEPVELVPAT
jgi:transposase-like protein